MSKQENQEFEFTVLVEGTPAQLLAVQKNAKARHQRNDGGRIDSIRVHWPCCPRQHCLQRDVAADHLGNNALKGSGP